MKVIDYFWPTVVSHRPKITPRAGMWPLSLQDVGQNSTRKSDLLALLFPKRRRINRQLEQRDMTRQRIGKDRRDDVRCQVGQVDRKRHPTSPVVPGSITFS